MSVVAIVEQLHVVEDLGPRLLARVEAAMVDVFVLQVAEEAFHHGVVVGVALAAHAGDEVLLSKLILIDRADIPRALVAVMQQSGRGTTLFDRQAQGGQAQRLGALDGMDYPRGLAHIGPPARRAIPALRRALTEEMHGHFFVPSGSTAATMVGAVVSIHGMMGLAERPETQD